MELDLQISLHVEQGLKQQGGVRVTLWSDDFWYCAVCTVQIFKTPR